MKGRTEAQQHFRLAARLDSTFRAAALALPRTLLAGIKPDSLPGAFLLGARECAQLTSAVRPKLEEYIQMDEAPALIFHPMPALPAPLQQSLALSKPLHLYLHVLVSERGEPLLLDLPYVPRSAMPGGVVGHIAQAIQTWRFRAAVRHGEPQRGWASVEYVLEP